jgi:opacity protein-like surface antigen
MHKLTLSALVVAAVGATSLAAKPAEAKGFSLGVDLGASIFIDAKTGFGLELFPGYEIIDGLDLELNTGFHRYSYGDGGGRFAYIPFMPGVRYTFDLDGPIAPFVTGHVGVAMLRAAVDTGFGSVSVSSTEFGLNVGGGAQYLLNEKMGLGLSATYHLIFGDGGNADVVDIALDYRIHF